jgi:hypothetical protein
VTLTPCSFDGRTRLIEHEELDLAAVGRLLDSCIAASRGRYKSAEAWLAETYFGLENRAGSRLDISVINPSRIHISFEGSEPTEHGFIGLLHSPFTYEGLVSSRHAVAALVEHFEAASDPEMKAYLESTHGRESWWSRLRR